mgnify:CR=1 FL=1
MSYTTKVLWIDRNTFSETEKASWTQDLLLKRIRRPISANPKYLLILKDDRFIVVDKSGSVILDKSVTYGIGEGAINNDGKVAIRSGADLYVYDIDGNELFHTTFANNLDRPIHIGLQYLYVRTYTKPTTVYIYDLDTFGYTSFSVNPYDPYFFNLIINDIGDKFMGIYSDDASKLHIFRGDTSGLTKDVNTDRKASIRLMVGRPDLLGALVVGTYQPVTTYYCDIILVNFNLDWKVIDTESASSLIVACPLIDANLTRMLLLNNLNSTVKRFTIDLNSFTATYLDSFDIIDKPEHCSDIYPWGDMTPDGKFAIVPATKIKIIDFDEKSVVKEIPKAFSGKPIKVLVT